MDGILSIVSLSVLNKLIQRYNPVGYQQPYQSIG